MQPDGTLCNTGSVCVGGRCKTQLAATAVPFVLATNLSISATLATFTNTLNGEPSSAFTATVDWGDGTSSAGVVSGVAGYYGVSGSHTYSSHDIVRVTVGINDTITTNQVSASFLAGYTLNEYPVQNPVGITLDTLNWPWVTQQSSQLAQLSYQGVPKEFAAPPGSAIAPTINIGLWYVEPTKIAFVTSDEDLNGGPTALVIQEFPLPGSGRTASNITADFAAMDAWFTETDRIARITQAGTITEYTIPTPNSDPRGITRGDDGVLWFTEYAASKIGKFVISTGAFTEYPTPTPLSYPDGITWGPGGIWFTEAGNNAIAYINSSGVITEYPLPTAAAFPHAIVPTAFQGLWFTEPGANKIGNINNGQITEYPVPTPNSMPWDLTAGDAIWFTERSANQVGYLKVAQ